MSQRIAPPSSSYEEIINRSGSRGRTRWSDEEIDQALGILREKGAVDIGTYTDGVKRNSGELVPAREVANRWGQSLIRSLVSQGEYPPRSLGVSTELASDRGSPQIRAVVYDKHFKRRRTR